MLPSSHPHLDTERLILRPLVLDDAAAFRVMTDEPAITELVHFLPSPFSLADARDLIQGRGDGYDCFWGVWLRDSSDLIGAVGTHLHAERQIEIGYWLRNADHGRGLGGEAVSAIIRMLKRACPEHRIFAECRLENVASWRLLQKLDFRFAGEDGTRPGRKRLDLA